jgi:hypothetical protein
VNDVKKPVLIELSHDEALVLFEWLARVDGSLPVVDPTEQDVLWRIEGQLEKTLVEPLAADYKDAVDAARSRLRDKK